MATQPPPGASWAQMVEQVCSALAASGTAVELSFENMEVLLPRDGSPDAPPFRVSVNGTLRLRVSAGR